MNCSPALALALSIHPIVCHWLWAAPTSFPRPPGNVATFQLREILSWKEWPWTLEPTLIPRRVWIRAPVGKVTNSVHTGQVTNSVHTRVHPWSCARIEGRNLVYFTHHLSAFTHTQEHTHTHTYTQTHAHKLSFDNVVSSGNYKWMNIQLSS